MNLDSASTAVVLGVRFFAGTLEQAVAQAAQGGLVVFPSGPGMACDLLHEPAYREALANADLAMTDSALMVMAHNVSNGDRLPRISGLRFLRAVLELPEFREAGATFWVMPSEEERTRNLAWLRAHGIEVPESHGWVAPRYGRGEISDPALVEKLNALRPRWVVLGIGGGVQERLGWHLRQALGYKPAILCIGAAIAFITGGQASIPPWVDRLYLGWLLRCVRKPSTFVPRYWASRRLPWLVWRYRERLPPASAEPPNS